MLVGYVSTPSAGNPPISLSCPSADTLAQSTLDIFGKTSDYELSPYWFHALQLFFMTKLAPSWLMKMVMEKEKIRVRQNYHKNK